MSGKRVARFLAGLALALAGTGALAQALVEAVQYPAWLERGGEAQPLLPATPLQARDVIVTGAGGRAHLRLAEGSRGLAGENARIVLQRDELVVAAGAFRLVTAASTRALEVAVRVGRTLVVTRGGDLWCRAAADRDIAMLLDGRATVGAEAAAPITLEQRLDRVEAARTGGASLARTSEAEAALWTKEAEMSPDGAVAMPGGRWRVLVGKFESGADARVLQRNVRAAGYPAEVAGGRDRAPYVVLVPGFAGEAEARAGMARLRGIEGAGILTISESAR